MLEITVKTLDSQNHSFTCEDDITVHGFKEHIADTVNVPVESQRLIYCGRVLQDDKKLNDYGNVNGKVIHLVQRAPPQPESRSNNNDGQRQNSNQGWPHGTSRVQYHGQLHRNAMYLGAMSVPPEVVEGLPAPQLSNTLSNSRLVAARSMLNKAIQLIDRLDDPTVPLHPSPTENSASEQTQQASAPEQPEQSRNVNSNENERNGTAQAASETADRFPATELFSIRLVRDASDDGENVAGSVVDPRNSDENAQTIAQVLEPQKSGANNLKAKEEKPENLKTESPKVVRKFTEEPRSQTPETNKSQPGTSEVENSEVNDSKTEKTESSKSEKKKASWTDADRSVPGRSDAERPNTSTSTSDPSTSRRSTPQVPRPPQMAELLEKLVSTQDRLRPYIEHYRVLMLSDPTLNARAGPDGVPENQRIVDGVSESLHFLAHACHALSDIIVDMGQQPPRNLRCRPIIIQHSAILQAGIPIQLEPHINLTSRSTTNNNNTTDEGNEATRPSSPTTTTADQPNRTASINIRTISQNLNGQQNQPSLLGTLLNLPSNMELSMELSPQSTIDLSSPGAMDGSENEQGQSNNNNNNGNVGGAANIISMTPPFALIRQALQSALNERHSEMESSNGATINTATNIPFVTIVGQQTMDIGAANSGQSTQARSNIGTHPTTSTQTRSTARPHVLHPHTHPLNVGVGMGQNFEFDPFLPCNSHHVRRTPPGSASSTSTSQSNQGNQSTTSENRSRSQSASQSSASARNAPQAHNISFGGNVNLARDLLQNEGQALAGELALTIGELLQASDGAEVGISVIGTGPNGSEIHFTPNSHVPLAELLRTLNVRVDDYAGRNFLIDLWLFLLRNVTFGGLMQLNLGQSTPLMTLRRPLREFLEHSFPNVQQEALREQIVEQIVTLNRQYLDYLVVPELESANRRVNIPATIEAMLRKFCFEFLKLLFNNDLDDSAFAQEAVTLAKKLEDQSSAVLQHILQGGQTTLENIVSRFVEQLTEVIHPHFQLLLFSILNPRIRAFATRTSQMSQSEITSLLVYKDEPSAPPAESVEAMESETVDKFDDAPQSEGLAQALPLQQQQQELKDEKMEITSELMDIEQLDDKLLDSSMDLAGEEIPETFPGAENLPPEWVPIIARDTVRQRRQVQMQALQGGPLPFSDAYLSCMPSKRRKLIEQQKPQILVNPTPANTTPIVASVERLVRESIAHSQVEEAQGAASAVAAVPAVRSAFGQAIKDCLHPGRLKTPDFPNARRFPNATKYFAPGSAAGDTAAAPSPGAKEQQASTTTLNNSSGNAATTPHQTTQPPPPSPTAKPSVASAAEAGK